MISLLGGFVFGLAASVLLWSGLKEMFARSAFQRRNYRDSSIATAAGLIIVVSVYFAGALTAVLASIGVVESSRSLAAMKLTALVVGGFGLLGLLDDLAVDEGTSGYLGHIRALARGRLSAGALKMVAGPAIALVVVEETSGSSFGWLLAEGAIVALAANLANLLDRAPGRVTKAATCAVLVLVVGAVLSNATSDSGMIYGLLGATTVLGAAWGLLWTELGEELMLGDSGANPLGAAIGLAVVLTQSAAVKLGVLVFLVALNLISERVSFSRVIDRVGPLRFVDQLGRRSPSR